MKQVPNGSKRNVKKFLAELSALTLKYGIMIEACTDSISDPVLGIPIGLYLNGYAFGHTLAGPIVFGGDHYYERR